MVELDPILDAKESRIRHPESQFQKLFHHAKMSHLISFPVCNLDCLATSRKDNFSREPQKQNSRSKFKAEVNGVGELL